MVKPQAVKIASSSNKLLYPIATGPPPRIIKVGQVQLNTSFSNQYYFPLTAGMLQAYARRHLQYADYYQFIEIIHKFPQNVKEFEEIGERLGECDKCSKIFLPINPLAPQTKTLVFFILQEGCKMKKTRVLVCGASGFIGRNIFEHLSIQPGIDLIGTYNTNKFSDDSRLVQVELTDRQEVYELIKGVDVIIQAAAVTSGAKDIAQRPYIHVTDNEIMNALIFQAAYDYKVKHVIYFSCSVMYPTTASVPVKETDALYDGIYDKYFGVAWMKIGREKDCEFYSRLGRTKFTVIRHSNIYGPHDKYDLDKSHVFGATIRKVMDAPDNGAITVWGEGREERDLLYVSDLVSFVRLAVCFQSEPFILCNIGMGQSVSIRSLIAKIIRHSGKKLDVVYDKTKPVMATKLALDCTLAKERFSWIPWVNLDSGIQNTITWYKNTFNPPV